MRPLALFVVLLAACAPELQLDSARVNISCEVDGVCPSGLVCLNGSRCVSRESIDGVGAATPLVPVDGELLTVSDVTFAWSTVESAKAYTITVSTDRQFATVVFESMETGTTATTSLPDGTYYWRVIADSTDLSRATPEVSEFGIARDAMHVYCAQDDCSGSDDELGTAQRPYRSIARAMNAAIGRNMRTVKVASKPNNAPYIETIYALDGLTVSGGYGPDFASSDGRTAIAVDGPAALNAAFIRSPTRIEHFAFRNTSLTETTAIRIFRSTRDLSLVDVEATAAFWNGPLVDIQGRVDKDGPQLLDSSFQVGRDTPSEEDVYLFVVSLDDAAVTLAGETLVRFTSFPTEELTTLKLHAIGATNNSIVNTNGGRIEIEGNGNVQTAYAIRCSLNSTSETEFHFRGVDVRIAGVGLARAIPEYCRGTLTDSLIDITSSSAVAVEANVPLLVERSRIYARATATFGVAAALRTTYGIGNTTVIRSSTLYASSLNGDAFGVMFDYGSGASVLQSTIVVGDSRTQTALQVDGPVAVVNSALIVLPTTYACGGVVCHKGVNERGYSGGTSKLVAFTHNALIGFDSSTGEACEYAIEYGGCVDLTGDDDVHPATEQPYFASNNVFNTIADAGVSLSTYRPSPASPLVGAGIDPAQDVCKRGQVAAATPACGGNTNDQDNTPYASPPSIGALNAAQ